MNHGMHSGIANVRVRIVKLYINNSEIYFWVIECYAEMHHDRQHVQTYTINIYTTNAMCTFDTLLNHTQTYK